MQDWKKRMTRWLGALALAAMVAVPEATAQQADAGAVAPIVEPEVALPEPSSDPGWLGVGLKNVEGEAATALGLDGTTAQVKTVFRGSPAETAGVKAGDLVLRVGDARLRTGMKEMIAHVKSNAKGSTLRLLVRRDGADQELSVALTAVPDRRAMVESEWLNRQLPELPLRDLTTGRALDPEALRGKVVLIDAWATWCGPCKRAMPLLEELQKQYALKGLKVLGVSDEDRPVLESFVRNRPVGYQIAHDPDSSLAGVLYVSSLPTFFVVDREGIIRDIKYGTQGAQELEATVKLLLGTP